MAELLVNNSFLFLDEFLFSHFFQFFRKVLENFWHLAVNFEHFLVDLKLRFRFLKQSHCHYQVFEGIQVGIHVLLQK